MITKIIPTEKIFRYPKNFNKRIEERKIEIRIPRLRFFKKKEKKQERQITKSIKKKMTGEKVTFPAS